MKATATTPTTDRPTSRRKPAASMAESAVPTKPHKPGVHFFYDEKGRKSHVLLDIKLYEKLMDELEEREDARDFALAIASGDQGIPLAEFRTERAARKQRKAKGA